MFNNLLINRNSLSYFCCCEIQICLLLVSFISWLYLAPAPQKWCWRTRTAWKKSQAATPSPPLSVLVIHLPVFSRLCYLSLLLRSFFILLYLPIFYHYPLLFLSLGFGTVVVIKDIVGLDLFFVVTSPVVLSDGVCVSAAIAATTLKYCCGSHNL